MWNTRANTGCTITARPHRPILAIGLCGLAVLVHPVFERVFHTYDALNNVVDENLQGIRVVKSYNRESFEVGKFGRISQRIVKDGTKA